MRFLRMENIDDNPRVARPRSHSVESRPAAIGGIEYSSVVDWQAHDDGFRSEKIREAVDRLPRKQRHMVERVFFGGATAAEASREIDVSETSGKTLLNNGLEKLRARLS